jgi:hypothetical protein
MFAAHVTHTLLVAATAVEYVFAKQFVHAAEPVVSLNVPASQALQGASASWASNSGGMNSEPGGSSDKDKPV